MSDAKELKPKSFRIDDATAEKIKVIANNIGGNQQEAFIKLIEAYEFQSGKIALNNKSRDIEKFEQHINVISRMFMSSLEDNQCMAEIIRAEFDALLKSKDTIIQDLQKRLKTAEQLRKEAMMKSDNSEDENKRLHTTINKQAKEYEKKIEHMQLMLNDKDNLNKTLYESYNELKSKIELMESQMNSMKSSEKYLTALQKDFDKLKIEFDQVTKSKLDTESLLEQERMKHNEEIVSLTAHEKEMIQKEKEQSQITIDKAIIKAERQYQQQTAKLNSEKQIEISAYLQKYSDLLEKNSDYIKQINKLETELKILRNNLKDKNSQ